MSREQVIDDEPERPSVPVVSMDSSWNMTPGARDIPTHDITSYLEHIRSGHYPKLPTCVICQLSDAPPFRHEKSTR
eukprot:4643201-Amphidinium_carterae.1